MMVEILSDLLGLAQDCAKENVDEILRVAKRYLSSEAHDSLRQFQNLYFQNNATQEKTDIINDDISSFVEQAQKVIASGKSLEDCAQNLLSKNEDERLGISQAQKQIESLVSLEDSLKEKLLPIIGTLQFEDGMSQRAEHLKTGMEKILPLSENIEESSYKDLLEIFEKMCVSKEETEDFYEHIKKEEAPKIVNSGTVFTF